MTRTTTCTRLRNLALSALAISSALVGACDVTAQSALPLLPSDTVLRLAVDPARNVGQPFVVLLDEGVVQLEPDGRTRQRNRRVVQVLDENAARSLAEQSFGYAKSHQRFTLEWVRVLRTTGVVVSNKPAQEQEGDVPAAMSNPVYQDQRVRRVSLAGVAAGTIVDIAYSLEELAPSRTGDFLFRWALNGAVPVRRSHFTLDVPEAYLPHIVERNLTVQRRDDISGGRRRLTWTTSDQQGIRAEPFASDSNGLLQTITVAPRGTWTDIARWYDGLAKSRYALSALSAQRIDSIVRARGARTRADTIRAVHKFIAQDIRYLSVALGTGGYQPRAADEVLATAFGDCKDKATLFIAALRRYRIEANPVLLSLNSRPDPSVTSVYQFNHAIAAVREGRDWTYVDLTADYVPYGEIPESYQGSFGVVVAADASAERITFPLRPTDRNLSSLKLAMRIDADGRTTGNVVEQSEGAASYLLRQALAAPLDSAKRAGYARALLQRLFGPEAPAGAMADSLTAFDGRDLSAVPRLSYSIAANAPWRSVGSAKLLAVPQVVRGPARQFRTALRELESQGRRQLPIDASRILPSSTTVTEWTVTLPAGWTAELPANVSATSFFGSYSSTWSQTGRLVRVVRRLQGQRGVYGPERIAEVLVWLRTVGADDQDFLTVKPSAAPSSP